MSEDRDKRRPRTPPVGVRAQTAAPVDDSLSLSWDHDVTPLPDDPRLAMARMDRRVKITGQAAIDRFDLMRTQVAGDVRDVHLRIDVLSSRLAQMAESTAAVVGKLDVLMQDREEISVVRLETARTELEIRKSRAIAEVGEDRAQRAHRRKIMLRVLAGALAGVSAVWAAVSTLLLARGC